MARGYFSGLIAGTLVSVVVLGAASVLMGPKGDAVPDATSLDVPAGSEFNKPREDSEAALPGVEDTPDAGETPQVSAPEPDDLASLDAADTEPAAQPETGSAEGTMSAPETGTEVAGVEVDSESPVLPSPQAMAPSEPSGEEELSISTDPAQPAMPEAEDSAAFPESEEKAAMETEANETAMEAITEEPAAEDSLEETVADESAAEEPATEGTAMETVTQEPAVPEPQDVAVAEEDGDSEADENSSTIRDLAPEVKTNRLPSVTDEAEAETEMAEADTETETEAEPSEEDISPLERFAVPFENPGDKPLMSIILIDDGSSPVGLQALESFPYPLSFAVKANWDKAQDAMIKYRAAGFEVLALTDLPAGADAQDTEVAMQATFAAMPEVVAIMEGSETGLQSSREAAEQLTPILLDSGHGLVLFPKGLNTAQKLAAREGVPSATVFRDFDAKGQNATVIRRFLDQAAFKAGQEKGGVVMVGRLRPDTVSALLLWGLQDRAARVALAPISAMLRQE